MELYNIRLQICRHNYTSLYRSKFIVGRETDGIIHAVSDHRRKKLKDFRLIQRSRNHREYLIHYVKNGAQTCAFRLAYNHLDNFSLSFRTSHVKAGRIPDTAVGSNLHTIQMITIVNFLNILRLRRKFNRCIIFSSLFRSLHTVIVHVNDFRIGHVHIKSAEAVHDCGQSIKIHSSIICNIQIKIGVQHGNRLFRPSVGIGRVRLGIGAVSQIQQRIPVYGNQLYILRIIVDAGNDHRIAVLRAKSRILISVVNTKQGIGRIACKVGGL